ncbi:hypothetical protein Tco_0977734, partial [Tanacetum coccineum]
MHKMKEGYGNDAVTLYPIQVFSVNNWALKPNQPEEPPFTYHMLAICVADKPVVFKAPKTSSKAESVSQGTKPIAQTGHKKPLTSSKQPSRSSKETTKVATNEARANPQLSSGMLAFNLNEPIYSASFIIYFEYASRNDASVASITKADPVSSAPRASLVASQIEEETSSTIKLEDLEKLVSRVQPSFKDLDSPEDDHVIVVNDSDKDKDDEVHAIKNSQKYKLKLKRNKAEAKAALFKAQLSFPNVEQLKELLVKSLKTKFSNILSAHDFSSSLTTELNDLPSKFNDLTKEEEAKAEAAKRESEVRKEELIDLLGQEVVNKKDGTSEIIPNFKASDLHLGKWREVMKDIPLRKDDPLDILNDLANKKRKHADDIHDYFKANKRLKSSFQYEYHLPGIVLNEPILEIFFKLYQGPRLDDHARTFSSLLLVEINKRNLNPLKQMGVIEQLRGRLLARVTEASSASALQKLKRVVSLLEGLQGGKRLLYVKRKKEISLGNVTYKVGIELHQLSLKDCT